MKWQARQRWALGLGAILTEANGGSHRFIGGEPLTPPGARRAAAILDEWWAITSAARLHERLTRLGRTTRGAVAWDHCRRVSVAGWGYRVGWLDERGFFDAALASATIAQSTYTGWQELADAYLASLADWSGEEDEARRRDVEWLLRSDASPWTRLPWALDLSCEDEPDYDRPAAERPPRARHRDADAAWTVAQRFLLTLGAQDSVLNYRLPSALWREPPCAAMVSHCLGWFEDANRNRAFVVRRTRELYAMTFASLLDGLRRRADRVRGGEALEDATDNASQARWVQLVLDEGAEGADRALCSYHATYATDLVRRGVAARLITEAEAWDLLAEGARVLRERFTTWEQLWRGFLDAVAAEYRPQHLGEEAMAALRAAPPSLYHLPWDTDLDAVDPVTLPASFDAITITMAIQCRFCHGLVAVDRVTAAVACEGCGVVEELSNARWRAMLADPLVGTLTSSDPTLRFSHADPRSLATVAFAGAVSCAGCGQPLELTRWLGGERHPLARLAISEETLDTITCAACGEVHQAQLPGDRTRALLPGAVLVLLSDGSPSPGVAPILIGCGECGAPLTIDGTVRTLTCDTCRTAQVVPASLWRRFHPITPVPAWRLVVVPEPHVHAPDARYRSTKFTESGAMIVDRGLSLWRADVARDGAAPPLPEGPLRFALALGAADTARRGGDPSRLGGAPPLAAYRAQAHALLDGDDIAEREPFVAALEEAKAEVTRAAKGKGKARVAEVAQAARRVVELVNLGFLVDHLDAGSAAAGLASTVAAVTSRFSGWEAWWQHAAIDEAWGLDPPPDWDRPAPRWSPPLARERVHLAASRRCLVCFCRTPIHHFGPEQRCVHCEAVTREEGGLADVVTRAVFASRRDPPETTVRATDVRVDGDWQLTYRRSSRWRCRCGAEGEMSDELVCEACGRAAELVAPPARLRALCPRLVGWIASQPKPDDEAAVVRCAGCGGSVVVDGIERVLPCAYCGASLFVPDAVWLRLHPRPPLTGVDLVVARRPGRLPFAMEEDWSPSLLVMGAEVAIG